MREAVLNAIYILFSLGCVIRRLFFAVFILLCCAILAAPAAAQNPPEPYAAVPAPSPQTPVETQHPMPAISKTIVLAMIPRVTRPPRLEDFLASHPREAELRVDDFRQYQPDDGAPATEPTSAYLSHDARNLYVVIVCRDEPDKVFAHLSKREDSFQDDNVAIFLDTFRDLHRAYYFSANPLGLQTDAIYTEGQGYDFSFDTLWYSEGRLTPTGYIVSFSIPFKSLRFSSAPEQTWGVLLYRFILRKGEVNTWPGATRRVEGLTQQFAPVGGLAEISPGRNIQLIPYGLLARNRFLDQTDPANPRFRTAFEHRAGLDAKFVAKDALTFDVTLNPDFSQVESDDPQVTINQRFAVLFPEKRPFFIENAGFFQTPVTLFFSRQIQDPQFGARMTGKLGRWALGALVIDDRAPGLNQPRPFDRRAADGVFRVAREFGKQSLIGAFFSTRDFAGASNRVAALDTRIKFSPNWVLDAQAAHSWTRQDFAHSQDCFSSNTRVQGSALFAEIAFAGRHVFYNSTYNDKTPGFCAQLGFVNRVDIRRQSNFVSYLWRPGKSRLIAFGPSLSQLVNWDHAGRVQDWEVAPVFQFDFIRQTSVSFTRRDAYELFAGIGFRKHLSAVSFTSQPYKWLTFNSQFSTGTGENFFPAAPLAPFLGNTKRFNLGFTLRPASRFRLDETYIFSRLGTRQGSTPPGFSPGQSIFNDHLMRSKVNYQFTKQLSLRMILDYNATLANPDLVNLQTNLGGFLGGPLAPTKRLTGDVLLTYLLHPGTAFYVGYTDGYSNLQLSNMQIPPVTARGSPTTSTGRIFFVKLSYLFRY